MGNSLPTFLEDGGVEQPRVTLFDYAADDSYSDDDVVIDLEANHGGGQMDEIVEFTPEDTALSIWGMLKNIYPASIPICKQMLYFSMMYSEVDVDDTDLALGNILANDDDEIIECYWMMQSHIYVDILKYNKDRLGVDPVYESVSAEDLNFVCIQKEHIDKCVNLFWDKFIAMKLEVFVQPPLNGVSKHENEGAPVIQHVVEPSSVTTFITPLYGSGHQSEKDPVIKKDD